MNRDLHAWIASWPEWERQHAIARLNQELSPAAQATDWIALEEPYGTVMHPGPQEEADLYQRRCEMRRRVYEELVEELGVEDKLAIENDPRWRYPLGDGIEPSAPLLVGRGLWVIVDA